MFSRSIGDKLREENHRIQMIPINSAIQEIKTLVDNISDDEFMLYTSSGKHLIGTVNQHDCNFYYKSIKNYLPTYKGLRFDVITETTGGCEIWAKW